MIYTPDWEPLASALQRVAFAHGDLEESKAAVCNAIADNKIVVRVTIDPSHHRHGGMTFAGGNVGVPVRLNSDDFDWTQSRPLQPWRIGPRPGEHYTWIGGWEPEPIRLIELLTADVTRVLLSDTIETMESRNLRRPKAAPKSERIESALKKRGFDRDRQGKSYKQIAHIIGPEVSMGISAKAVDALAKGVERCLNPHSPDNALSFGVTCAIQI